MIRYASVISSLLIICILGVITACSDTTFQEQPLVLPEQPDYIVGQIAAIDSQIILMTEGSDYLISGMDLSTMVGKNVRITGTVFENEGIYTITATAVDEVQ